jgi:Bacterial lectin
MIYGASQSTRRSIVSRLAQGVGLGLISALAILPQNAEAASFNYSNFSNTTGLNLVGSAYQDGDRLQLHNGGQEWQSGGLWFNMAQAPLKGFETTFQFRINNQRSADNLRAGQSVIDPNGNIGGDGFAFVMRNQASWDLGYSGGGLGYSGIANSIAVEFDTWNNQDDFTQWGNASDKPGSVMNESTNHISIQASTDGVMNEFPRYSIGYSDAIDNLSSGDVHTAKIRYENGRMQVSLNQNKAIDISAINLNQILNSSNAIIGFTGSTGGSWENHELLNWSYQELELMSAPASQPVAEPSALLGLLGLLSTIAKRRTKAEGLAS